MKHPARTTPTAPFRLQPLAAACLLALAVNAQAAPTDISATPMASGSTTAVKPNVMFILDDSGSMGRSHLPDNVDTFYGKWGYKSSHCNGVYYNPAITYSAPVKDFNADGTANYYPNASFTNAKYNGYSSSSSTVNLSSSFRSYDSTTLDLSYSDTAQAAYYYRYIGSTSTAMNYTYNSDGSFKSSGPGSELYTDCTTDSSSTSTRRNRWTKVTVGASEQQNFANWYSYYRLRSYTMKAAVSKAFRNIDDNYRVGYTTHSYTGTDTTSSSFLNIADFTIAQKNAWYTKMLGSGSSANGTPLIAALSKVGRIYAGRIGDNPVQYSCQQNFAILSTDGYWNNYLTNNSANVDGAAIGDQDGNLTSAPRPFYDGAGTQSNTLSDVAMYYYKTDLRPTMEDNVPGAGEDKAAHQHMTTFTLGLGVDGTLKYQSNYASAATGDFAAIKAGTKDWPTPVANTQTAVDDLWHAAVNGRGVYYSAKDPDSLTDGIEKALAGVTARTSTAAAAATSNLEPVAGDNFAYVASYQTVKWDGDLQARSIDLNTGDVGSSAIWSARDKLDTKVSATSDTRTIYFFDSGVASKLKPFTFANLNPTQQGYFNVASSLSQYPEIAATPAWLAQATGTNLVNYLRGQYQFEDQTGNPIPIFRDREHVLGDIVNGKPAYVKAPRHNWVDADYASYKAANVDRTAMVYVAANDGMLHAFDAVTGDEKWAFIPSAVMPNLYKLADKNYANNHRYTVDGSPVIEDVVIGGAWKTILIGGLNSGGRSYYALDITDPNSPKALWEFSVGSGAGKDADLGYTYGNAVVAKRPNGTWVVVVTSGYNNTGTGDGKGHFYLLDPATGNVLNKVSTTAGSAATPSGLGRINTWVDTFDTNNTAKRVYGGDLEGNLWSLNLETLGVDKLTTLKGSSGAVQPITTIPELGDVKGQTVIFVATGRYLGISDLTDTSTQSLYAIKDNLSGGTVSPRGGTMRQRTLTNTTGSSGEATRTVAGGDVDFETDDGWYVDFPDAGERANVDPQLVLGTLLVPTNVPNANSCNVGGYSWLNYFKYDNGLSVNGADDPTVGTRMGNALIVGMQVVRLPNKKTVPIISKSDYTFASPSVPFETKDVKGHRVSWREIFTK